MRYVVTGEAMLIAGSESRHVPVNDATVLEKGALALQMNRGRHGRGQAVPRPPT